MTVRIIQDSCFKDDFGYPVTLDTEIILSSATSVKIKATLPDDTVVEWSASVYNTTKVRHVLATGELSQVGTYYLNAYALNGTTWQRTGDTFILGVVNIGERLNK